MTLQEKMKLIRDVGEEIVTEEDLQKLLSSGEQLVAYDGFEPSGQIHIAQGLLKAINVNKMTKAGVKFKMFVADWHAWANKKLGGDLEKIQTTGKYFIEVWKACGMDLSNVEFVWASDMVKNPEYWKLVVQVGRSNALKRFVRTAEMMGRDESMDNLTGANIIYSCMQVADIFLLGAKITQLGMDQRKLNMLAREIGPQLGFWKPVVVSHHMLMGLQKPPSPQSPPPQSSLSQNTPQSPQSPQSEKIQRTIALKMSKSQPDSAVFMTDTREDIQRKIGKAWAPEGEIKENPVLEYCKYIIFPALSEATGSGLQATDFLVERPEKFGGNLEIQTYDELEKLYAERKLHPMDLKNTVVNILDNLIAPVRRHFEENAEAKKLLETVKSYSVTR